MSAATAKTHVSRAMIKLGARDRAQLVVFAYETRPRPPRLAALSDCAYAGGVGGEPPAADDDGGRRGRTMEP